MMSMTLEQAKEILRTYQLPLTPEQMQTYKEALRIVAGAFAILRPENN